MAKFLRLLVCLATVFLLTVPAFQLSAQSFTALLEPHTSVVLAKNFSNYQVFQLDAPALNAYVNSNAEAPAKVNIGSHQWQLNLTPTKILADYNSLQVQTPQGIVTTYPKKNIAFQGYELTGGGVTRLTLNGDFLYGFVQEGTERFYVEPLWYFEPDAAHNLYVIYPQSAVLLVLGPDACGVTQEQMAIHRLEDDPDKFSFNNTDNSDCFEIELAIASDKSMFLKYGSVSGVQDHNIAIINDVNGDYSGNFAHDYTFVIVTQFVVTGSDPWTPSTDAGTLLGSFSTWGNNGNFGVGFDIGELWTNRDFDGGTVGIAYLNGVCNSNKYHCLQDFTGDGNLLRQMTSHEIGHNCSSGHDPANPSIYIMCPVLNGSVQWSDQSTGAINGYLQSKINNGCLTSCGPPPPPLAAGFSWTPDPGCQNQPVSFTDQSSGNITGWSWTFQGGTPATSTQQNPTVTWAAPGMKNVTLTITGQGTPPNNTITQVIDIQPLAVAGFTYTVNGLVLTFTNTSINATSYEWDFGDGTSSNDQDPVHEYADAGTYLVTLKASNACNTSIKTATINTAPTAGFIGSPTSGCISLLVTMENQSSLNAVNYVWLCPGGVPSTSNQVNPVITYAIAGTYSVTLIAKNNSGSDTLTRVNYITVNAPPSANFTSSTNGSTVTFTNTSIGNVTSYLWNFGDDSTSTQKNPVHVYANSGTYTVVLTATNECGSSTKSKDVTILSVSPPVAAFTANPSVGCAPQTVNFINNSTGAVSYSWSFPGGNPSTSTDANPTVQYNMVGVYTVTLTATNSNGSSTVTSTITINTVPTAGFTYSVDKDTTYSFTNTSTGATAYLWTFGDGDSSTVVNPVHDYPAIDSIIHYSVILRAINDCGIVNDTQIVTVITPPHAKFTATPTTGCAPLTVQFNNNSAPNATAFLWRFPGGTPDTSILKKPVVVYSNPGTYSVTLIAINPSGRDTSIRTNYIVVNTVPNAGFTSTTNVLTATFTNTTVGGVTYAWEFGDGDTSSVVNPVHTYATDGTYTVTLSATNACGTTVKTQSVTVATIPTAGFTISNGSGCAPLTVQFTNTSSSNATSYDWQFPGGNPSSSTNQNPPSVVYALSGTYIVTLTVSNVAGSSSFSQTIVVDPLPTANFSASVTDLTASFTNSSYNGITYSWDFGDGGSSTNPNPSHDYATDGTYTVVLTATNDCGTNTFTQNVVINTVPGAAFTANNTNGCAVLEVAFTDVSIGNPVSWDWAFPGGVPSSSNQQNPTVQYFSAGVYDVTLVVTFAGGGTSSFTQQSLVNVAGAPTVGFSTSVNGPSASFTNTSVGATSYVWNFGDGSNSTQVNPTHNYANDGVYNVVLTATNSCGSSIIEHSVTISTPPTAGFSYNGTGCAPFTVVFTNTSSSNATSYAWDFPGGNPPTSTAANPTATWNTPGVYIVTLTASNASGSSTSTGTITVGAAPTAGFTYQIGGLTAIFSNSSTNGDSYSWDFGDGSIPGTSANPSHTYDHVGTYMVSLTVTNECGSATVTQTVIIQGAAPVPAISANNTESCLPFSTQFMDQSTGNPTAWSWTFQGGTPSTSTNPNPSVSYSAAGTYDVVLTVTNIFGTATQSFPAYITVLAAPVAGFSFVANQLTVSFASTSQNATSYAWNFGDGTNSTAQDPAHTYSNPGTYTVSLAVSNNCGTAIFEQTIVLTSATTELSWIEGFRLFPNPNTGLFTVDMKGIPQEEVEFTLFNALGQQMHRETADFSAGSLLYSFQYGQLATGIYTLRVQAEGQAMYVKVIVNR